MSKSFLAAIVAAVAASVIQSARPPAAWTQPTVLRGPRVIDGRGGPPIEQATVVIADSRIVAITPAGDVEATVPAGARVIDYRGKTIIPGLISDHSHVGLVDGIDVKPAHYNRDNILRQLKQYEAFGVTGVTALGLNGALFYELRPELHAGRLPGADLFGADHGIGVQDGAPPAGMVPMGPDQLDRPATADAARQAVRETAMRHADLVKVWLDDFGGSLEAKMSPEVLRAVIDEAHKNGLRVASHIHDLADAKTALTAGVDIIAHGVRDRPVDAEFVAGLKATGAWYIPTLALDESTFVYATRPLWMQQPFFLHGIQPALRTQIDSDGWGANTLSNPRAAAARHDLDTNKRNLETLFDAGVHIGFGTDSGATALRIPGIAEHRELALLVDAGLTPLQALTLATANAAALLKLDDRGTLTPGKLADLVVLDANPASDISATTRIAAVWHRGRQAAGAIDTFMP